MARLALDLVLFSIDQAPPVALQVQGNRISDLCASHSRNAKVERLGWNPRVQS
eukprot:m.142430 g.142430  ORF g.142430 m.142430 type:complete len:53 (-) comp14066_c0_seq1:1397-1555(-)